MNNITDRSLSEVHSTVDTTNKITFWKKLFAFVCLAFVMCLSVCIAHHQNVKSIEMKNHGYKLEPNVHFSPDLPYQFVSENHYIKTNTLVVRVLDQSSSYLL